MHTIILLQYTVKKVSVFPGRNATNQTLPAGNNGMGKPLTFFYSVRSRQYWHKLATPLNGSEGVGSGHSPAKEAH
jgi:hypothetical protein